MVSPWLEGIAPGKVADFAGEAAAQDIDTLSRYDPVKRLALVAYLVHTARMRARDDLAERLIGTYRTVLEHLDPGSEAAGRRLPGEGEARAVAAVEQAGGFAAQPVGIEEVSAFHGDNYEVLVARFFRKDRAVMFELTGRLELVATTSDGSVLACLRHAREHWAQAPRFHPAAPGGRGRRGRAWHRVRLGKLAGGHHRPPPSGHGGAAALRGDGVHLPGRGAPHRRHRGRGADEYADWRANLLTWEECEPLLATFWPFGCQYQAPRSSPAFTLAQQQPTARNACGA
jgi:hypothetical protein